MAHCRHDEPPPSDTTPQQQEQQQQEQLHGAEPFVVGLSPAYWSHIPMTIADVTNLVVVNGIPCLHGTWIPVSKCTLVGTLVHANNNMYVLDDGTGLVDILAWGEPREGIYALPKLTKGQQQQQHDHNDKDKWRVSDTVRVMGRIECLSLGEPYYMYGFPQHDDDGSSTKNNKKRRLSNNNNQQSLAIRKGIFEIHANIMEPLSPNNTTRNPNDNALNLEANHWMKSLLLQQTNTPDTPTTPPTTTTTSTTTSTSMHPSQYRLVNANPVLDWLGPKIATDVVHQRHFPSADDTRGEWKVFGVHCTCHNLSYKDALLYCHCQATPEPLDPHLVYRDALLKVLLELEQQAGIDLRFQYRTMAQHAGLNRIASQQVAATSSPRNNTPPHVVSTLVQQLQVATFRALRKDGILYLLHETSDTHLLVSKHHVLEPYVRRAQGRKWNQLPVYLQQVPMARVRYVQRSCRADSPTTG